MSSCKTCKHAEFKRGPKGGVSPHTLGRCGYTGSLGVACMQHRTILPWVGEHCPAYSELPERPLTPEQYRKLYNL